jgi:hypothetical protein
MGQPPALEKVSAPQSGGYPYGAFGAAQRARWLQDGMPAPTQPSEQDDQRAKALSPLPPRRRGFSASPQRLYSLQLLESGRLYFWLRMTGSVSLQCAKYCGNSQPVSSFLPSTPSSDFSPILGNDLRGDSDKGHSFPGLPSNNRPAAPKGSGPNAT